MRIESIETSEAINVNVTEVVKTLCDSAVMLSILFGDELDDEGKSYISDSIFSHVVEDIATSSGKTPDEIYLKIRSELKEEET